MHTYIHRNFQPMLSQKPLSFVSDCPARGPKESKRRKITRY